MFIRTESGALSLSAGVALVVGVVAVTFSLLTNSQAILLDGVFNLAYFLTALFSIKVAEMTRRPDDERFPFGYGYFEALVNAVKGMLILGVSGLAFLDSAIAFATGGRQVVAEQAAGYAVFATVTCATVTVLLWRSHRKKRSPLVHADVQNWLLNTLISGTVLLGFVGTWVLEETDWARYVDPLLVALVVGLSIGIPVKMAGNAVRSLLNGAAPKPIQQPIREAIEGALVDIPDKELYVRITMPGRVPYVLVHVLLSAQLNPSVDELDRYRHSVLKAILRVQQPVFLDVLFTKTKKFAVPTAGFCLEGS